MDSDLIKAKEKLITLYQFIKITNQENNSDKSTTDKEKLSKLSLSTLVDYLSNSIDIIVNMKLEEELEKHKKIEENLLSHESLLIKAEAAIRKHISIENQLNLQCEKFQQKIEELQKEKNHETVINIYNFFNIIIIFKFIFIGKRNKII